MTADILDDLMRDVFEYLLKSPNSIKPSRGDAVEEIGVLLELKNPRARLSRTETRGKPFSCLGELLWFLAKSNELAFIRYYLQKYDDDAEDDGTLHGAYGPRLFSMRDSVNQIENVINQLKKGDSRRAVIQLFNAEDISRRFKEIPCTCTLQFFSRSGALHMFTNMRSNDAYFGLAHDFFVFTMLQEIIARTLSIEMGTYKHAVGSLHLYDEHRNAVRQFLDEGFQATTLSMPPMPLGDPWPSIDILLKAEQSIRSGGEVEVPLNLNSYWADLVWLLKVFSKKKTKDATAIASMVGEFNSDVYKIFIK